MTTLLLLLTLTADLVADINATREAHGVAPVVRSATLDAAAELQVEWLAFAHKKRIDTGDHECLTSWLLTAHPELLWERLLATYEVLPKWLVAHDLARLCGYGGVARDIGSYVGRKDSPIDGWLRNDHRTVLLDPDADEVGIAVASVGGGKFATWACFGWRN